MTRFVTIVPHIENLELRKDTGQIPFQLHKEFGYDATLVSYFYSLDGGRKAGIVNQPPTAQHQIDSAYPFLKAEVPGLKMHFLANEGRGRFYEKAIYHYLLKEAKNIDVLNLFHFGAEQIFYALVYKYKNPTGKVYLKLDIDIAFYKSQKSLFNTQGKFGKLKHLLYQRFLVPHFFRKIDLVSAESTAGLAYFSERFKSSAKKLTLVSNGVDVDRIASLTKGFKSFTEKENIILTVGRIGNPQKNHELLLQVIPNLALKNWKVYFAGPIEPSFNAQIESFFSLHPELKEKVIFTGNISDPASLYDLYNRAKIFCMPSKWEGFPLAAVESAVFGNIQVLSEQIHAFDTLTDGGKLGFKINENNLETVLNQLMKDEQLQEQLITATTEFAQEKFDWKNIVQQLHLGLNNER